MSSSLHELSKTLAALERKAADMRSDRSSPLAVVGVGCRFPGANSPEAFWDLLVHGRDAIREVPPERWTGGKDAEPRWGGFIDNVDGFDAAFFGIGAREAEHMDPQHRLVLEVVWEALNTAGIPTNLLRGSATGVYIGAYTDDYRLMHMADPPSIDAFSGTGTIHCLAANRISYLLDLRGPSLAVDATCASSLVAVHLASQSLARGECDVAIAGAVNLMLSPLSMVSAAKVVPMSPDGRCKTFSNRADGIVRGEGCGIVVLKRLRDAQAARDPVWAVIEGTAVNQDGRSNGMTAPNPAAQEEVLARALARANVSASDVDYIEAHGTGTPLGDPIEIESLHKVNRQPLVVGSVKTNLGHLEAAAGMAGLIKTILAVQKGIIPPHLHFEKWNPAIEGTAANITIPARPIEWPVTKSTRRAGVSAFSLGGTNAHVIVASPPAAPHEDGEKRTLAVLLPISAESPAALRELADSYRHLLERCESEAELKDICYTASLRRSHYSQRLAVLADTPGNTCGRLATHTQSDAVPANATVRHTLKRLVFVFPGQGVRWSRVGHELFESEPAFRESLSRSDALLRTITGWSLLDKWREPGALDRPGTAQPAILAVQLALVDLLKTYGIAPSAVIGHSLGETAAACVAGVFERKDALHLLARRGALVEARAPRGRMVALDSDPETAYELLRPLKDRVSVAAFNSPSSVVISGECEAIEQICHKTGAAAIRHVPLPTNYAFHSRQMLPVVPELRNVLQYTVSGPPTTPMYSTVTGRRFDPSSDPKMHWLRNLLDPVRFMEAVSAAYTDGYEDFLEIGPAALSRHVRLSLGTEACGLTGALLKKDRGEREALLDRLVELYSAGYDLAWESFFPAPRRVTQLPAYPWQRRRYWLRKPDPQPLTRAQGAFFANERTWTFPEAGAPCWHRLGDGTTFSVAGYIGAILDALGPGRFPVKIENLEIHAPLFIAEPTRVTIQTILVPRPAGDYACTTASRVDSSSDWRIHATAVVRSNANSATSKAEIPEHHQAAAADSAIDAFLKMSAAPFVLARGESVVLSCDSIWLRRPSIDGELSTTFREIGVDQASINAALLGPDGQPSAEIRGLRLRVQSSLPGQLQPDIYEVDWEPASLESPLAQIAHNTAKAPDETGEDIYACARKDIDQLCCLYSFDALHAAESADPKHDVLLSRLQELASRKNGSTISARDLSARLCREYPELQPELNLLERCATVLPDVIAGRRSALEPIFTVEGDGRSLADRVYHDSPFARYWNAAVQRAVLAAVESRSVSGQIRILEIGAGTGATTAAILPFLQPDRTEYWFTDLSNTFVNRARHNFREFSFVRHAQFDAANPSSARDLANRSFDIVIAANVLHAVASPVQTLRGLRDLVKPDGVLILLEGTGNRSWADLTFGVTDGWFHIDGQVRRNGPLFKPSEWVRMLTQAGWGEAIEGLSGPGHNAALILAARPHPCRLIVVRDLEAFEKAISEVDEAVSIVHCSALDAEAGAANVEEGAFEISKNALAFARTLLNRKWNRPPRTWFMTRGVREGASLDALAQSCLHGFARVFFTEHPEFTGGVIDLDPNGLGDSLAWKAIEANVAEDWLAVRNHRLEVPRLKPASLPENPPALHLDEGAYLITGGLGGVGLQMAEWLALNGAKHIVLVNRGRHDEAAADLARLDALGVDVLVRSADVAVRAELESIFAELKARGLRVRGVIHCAGVVCDGVIGQQQWTEFTDVLRPKVSGAWNLHELTRELQLDFFLLFSSACTLVGLSGLAAYTTANAVLDGLAAHRNSLGLPAQTIDWGGWHRTGMAERVGLQREHQWAARGLYTMSPAGAVGAFARAFQTRNPRLAIASIDWKQFRSSFLSGGAPHLFDRLMPNDESEDAPRVAHTTPTTPAPPDRRSLAAIVRAVTPAERATLFYSFLRDQLASLLAVELPLQLAPDESILELGLDSLMTVEMRNKLAGAFEVSLPVTALFDYPTPKALLSYITSLCDWGKESLSAAAGVR